MLFFWLGRRCAIAFSVALALLVAGGIYGVAATVEQAAVTIDGFAFGPDAITVKRGTTVTWTNKDDEPHTVVSAADTAVWKSPALDTDDHFSFTFTDPGTYKYFCSIHPRMQGTVVVE